MNTPEVKCLNAIEKISGDDFCEQVDWDMFKNRLKTEKEKIMANKLLKIYRLSHSHIKTHFCYHVHKNWRAER